MTNNVSFKERVRLVAIAEAKHYKRNYIDHHYLIYSESFVNRKFYILVGEKDNYLHLVEVNTPLSCNAFFDKCYNGTLLEQDFDFIKRRQSEKDMKGSVRRKITALPHLHNLIHNTFLLEEDFQKNTLRFAIATSDGNDVTLGFSYGSKSYPKSLLKGTALTPNFVLSKRMEDETLWLTQQQMVELFRTSRTNIVEHIKHIFEEGELEESSTCRKFRQVRLEGNREVARSIPYYNLDMIISLGYRIKSSIATNFRRWATERLKEYMIKDFTMDDERLKQLGGGNYWGELLERIRDIRSSEKVLYRQVLDLYATSVDYDLKSSQSVNFFKIVQNKLHYVAHGHTAAEII